MKKNLNQNQKLSEKQKSDIQWLLSSSNPEPLEFFQYLDCKVKNTAEDSYTAALSAIVNGSSLDEKRMKVFKDLQKKWQQGDFRHVWSTYIREKAEKKPAKTQRGELSTPNKPTILARAKPQVFSTKRIMENIKAIEDKEVTIKDNPLAPIGWRQWLNVILTFPIEEVRIQILTFKYTPKNDFEEKMIQYIGKVLMDYVNKVIDVQRHTTDFDDTERNWIVKKISPLFTFMEATFVNVIQFNWIEHDVEPTHERLAAQGNTSNKGRLKADIVGVRGSDYRQVVFLEMSGAPTDFLKQHTNDDAQKTYQERMDSLNSVLQDYLDYDVRFAHKIRSITIQGIRTQLILRALSLRGKDNYADKEVFSTTFPLGWDLRFEFIELFQMMEYVILSILEYPDAVKELMNHQAKSSEFSIRQCISYISSE